MAREKVLQILVATDWEPDSWSDVFAHIFFRQFTFEAGESEQGKRILRPDEVRELEADTSIEWSETDVEFATSVIRAAQDYRADSQEAIEKHLVNWEADRVALVDKILLHLAIAEIRCRSEIPIRVTINEVIELAKKYSTERSSMFINGVLDAIVIGMRESGALSRVD